MKCSKQFRLLRYDLKHGILEKRKNYIGVILLAVLLFADYLIRLHSFFGADSFSSLQLTLADVLLYMFSGRFPYSADEQIFLIPIAWLILFLYPAFLSLNYPVENLSGHGIQVLIRIRKRRSWWLSKCVYVLCSTLLYFFILYASLCLMCIFTGTAISLSFSEVILENMLNYALVPVPGKTELFILLFILPALVSISLNLLQACAALFAKPVYAFLLTAVLLLLSTYMQIPWLPGSYAMAMRTSWAMDGGLTWQNGILAALVFASASVFAGTLRIGRYDILKKEE